MHKPTFSKKIGLSFIVLVAILILINHQLNKDTNTPNRLTLSNLFTVDVNKSHVHGLQLQIIINRKRLM